jgi:hypothetical protein
MRRRLASAGFHCSGSLLFVRSDPACPKVEPSNSGACVLPHVDAMNPINEGLEEAFVDCLYGAAAWAVRVRSLHMPSNDTQYNLDVGMRAGDREKVPGAGLSPATPFKRRISRLAPTEQQGRLDVEFVPASRQRQALFVSGVR